MDEISTTTLVMLIIGAIGTCLWSLMVFQLNRIHQSLDRKVDVNFCEALRRVTKNC